MHGLLIRSLSLFLIALGSVKLYQNIAIEVKNFLNRTQNEVKMTSK